MRARQKKSKGKFIFKSDAFDAGFKAGVKAAKLEMAGKNRVMTAEERLKQMPKYVQMFVKENNLRVDHTLQIELHTPIQERPYLAGQYAVDYEHTGEVTVTMTGRRKVT